MIRLGRLLQPYVLFDIAGLSPTVIGALISALGTFVEDQHGRKIAKTEGPHNHELEDLVKTQSRSAKRGLLLIAADTLLHIVASILQTID